MYIYLLIYIITLNVEKKTVRISTHLSANSGFERRNMGKKYIKRKRAGYSDQEIIEAYKLLSIDRT